MKNLAELIRKLPVGVEFLLVVTWAFGLPIVSSIMSIGVTPTLPTFTNESLLVNVVLQLLTFALIVWFLRVRGWTLAKFGLSVTARETLWGLGLLAGVWALTIAVQVVAQLAFGFDMHAAMGRYPKVGNLGMQVVFVASAVNGVFEELFVEIGRASCRERV